MKQLEKKGNVSGLQGIAMALVGLIVVIVIGLVIVDELGGSLTADSTAANASETFLTKLSGTTTWVGLIIVVIFSAAVLSYFYMRG